MAHKAIIIKKYENRRLYDMTNSKYVNLDEIAQFVREGLEVKVIDAATGEDLTRLTLTQIIIEDAKAADSAFPLDMLRQMVMACGQASQESALTYMKAMFDMYQNAYQNAYQAFPFTPFGFMPNMPGRVAGPPPPSKPANENPMKEQPGAPPPPASATPEVDDLKRRISELESVLTASRPARASTSDQPSTRSVPGNLAAPRPSPKKMRKKPARSPKPQ